MTHDLNAADYCPTCGQVRERAAAEVEHNGLRLTPDNVLIFDGEEIRLVAGMARLIRAIVGRGGKATHEFLILSVSPEMESNVVQVYVCRLRKMLPAFSRGRIELRTIWGWGYELSFAQGEANARG